MYTFLNIKTQAFLVNRDSSVKPTRNTIKANFNPKKHTLTCRIMSTEC